MTNAGGASEEEVSAFFAQWRIYRKMLVQNHLRHDEIGAAVHRALVGLGRDFHVVDLGCGDAEHAMKALGWTRVASYTGVDLSEVALSLVEKNTATLPCERHVIHARLESDEVLAYVGDIAIMSYSFHHLGQEAKRNALRRLFERVRAGGRLFWADVFLRDGQTRDDYLDEYLAMMRQWPALSPEELHRATEHVTSSDFPESEAFVHEVAGVAGMCVTKLYSCERSLHRCYGFAAA